MCAGQQPKNHEDIGDAYFACKRRQHIGPGGHGRYHAVPERRLAVRQRAQNFEPRSLSLNKPEPICLSSQFNFNRPNLI